MKSLNIISDLNLIIGQNLPSFDRNMQRWQFDLIGTDYKPRRILIVSDKGSKANRWPKFAAVHLIADEDDKMHFVFIPRSF